MSISAEAQNHFEIVGGANLSTSSANDFSWRAGGYIGGIYDVKLCGSWYIQPQLLLSYEENKTKSDAKTELFYSQYAVSLPVLASYNINLSSSLSMRINAGPYIQYTMFGRENQYYSDASGKNTYTQKGWWHLDFGDRFTYGLKGCVAFEHNKGIVSFDYKYSFRKSYLNYDGHESCLSLGIGYKF